MLVSIQSFVSKIKHFLKFVMSRMNAFDKNGYLYDMFKFSDVN